MPRVGNKSYAYTKKGKAAAKKAAKKKTPVPTPVSSVLVSWPLKKTIRLHQGKSS